MRFFLLFCLAVSAPFTMSALAQGVPDRDEFVPEGPRGRWSVEQGRGAALRHIQGEIVATDIEREDDHVYYEYTIQQGDGSIYEVEINAANGNLYEIEIEHLSDNPRYPAGVIEDDYARVVAKSHVMKGESRVFKPKIKSSTIGVYERNLVYDVRIKRGVDMHRVFVDAFAGKVLESEVIK